MNYKQVQRYIRLIVLVPELQKILDEKGLAFTPAVEISFIRPTHQQYIAISIEGQQSTPSLSQAQQLRKLDKEGMLWFVVRKSRPEHRVMNRAAKGNNNPKLLWRMVQSSFGLAGIELWNSAMLNFSPLPKKGRKGKYFCHLYEVKGEPANRLF